MPGRFRVTILGLSVINQNTSSQVLSQRFVREICHIVPLARPRRSEIHRVARDAVGSLRDVGTKLRRAARPRRDLQVCAVDERGVSIEVKRAAEKINACVVALRYQRGQRPAVDTNQTVSAEARSGIRAGAITGATDRDEQHRDPTDEARTCHVVVLENYAERNQYAVAEHDQERRSHRRPLSKQRVTSGK